MGITLGQFPLRTNLKLDKGGSQRDKPKDTKIDLYAQGVTCNSNQGKALHHSEILIEH